MPRNTAGTLSFALCRSSRPILVPSFQSRKTVHEKSARVTKYTIWTDVRKANSDLRRSASSSQSCIVTSSVNHL